VKGDIEIRLERGIEAARAGEYERARDILIQVIELDQYNERAWLWLSEVVEIAADRFVCLENVLFINPDNARATAGLQDLRQRSIDDLALSATLPRLAVSQTLDEWRDDEWEWARKRERDGESKWEWDASATATSLEPAGKVCPRCGYRNPGWVYVCDRCGADLQPVDLRGAISSGSRPRGRSSFTLLEAWGGTFTFNRLFAFQPEVELAAGGGGAGGTNRHHRAPLHGTYVATSPATDVDRCARCAVDLGGGTSGGRRAGLEDTRSPDGGRLFGLASAGRTAFSIPSIRPLPGGSGQPSRFTL
jgi:hypothetical protein